MQAKVCSYWVRMWVLNVDPELPIVNSGSLNIAVRSSLANRAAGTLIPTIIKSSAFNYRTPKPKFKHSTQVIDDLVVF
jgi:hypothetical protein